MLTVPSLSPIAAMLPITEIEVNTASEIFRSRQLHFGDRRSPKHRGNRPYELEEKTWSGRRPATVCQVALMISSLHNW